MSEALALAALAVVLTVAVTRPRGVPEAAVAVPAALVLIALGVVPWHAAYEEVTTLAPTLAFLGAMLVLAQLADREGLFATAGVAMAGASRGSPRRLLALVFAAAAATTAVLSLDTTVVLLTPVVFATASRLGVRPRPHVLACVHLANSASLLLPVSNLSNLLALRASELSFTRFGALMAAPWLVAIAVEWLVLRRAYADDLRGRGRASASAAPAPAVPRHVWVVLAGTLAGFVASDAVGVDPAWVAGAGALTLALLARSGVREVVVAASLPFLVFVLALGVIVRGVSDHGLGNLVDALVPGGAGFGALLAAAALGAVLANMLNNLPAVLLLLPAASAGGPGVVLATLIGVNVGPNLTYAGSLATLLWRRSLARHGAGPELREFVRLGALTVPAVLLASTAALWLSLQAVGP